MRTLDLNNTYQKFGKAMLDDIMDIAKAKRNLNKVSQNRISAYSGVSVSYISKLETGRYPIRLVWFAAYLDALGFTLIPKNEDDV